MIRLVKRDKDGKVTAVSSLDIPRELTIVKDDPTAGLVSEKVEHPSLTASLNDGWEENYTDVLAPAPAPQPEFDFNTLKTEFANATLEEKINIMAKLLRLI